MTQLRLQIEELISQNASDFQISKVFKNYYKNYLDSIDTTLETTGGKDFFIKHTKHTDNFLILLYKYILRKHFGSFQPSSTSVPINLIALGSYGREQLCIYSDIDILILYEDIKGYNLKDIIEEFITLAWDCGINLGSRVHQIYDIADDVQDDITIKSSILESRLIYGSKILWFYYENILKNIRVTKQKFFIEEKLKEHKKRLTKYPLNMQANIKDGYGGIREANMVFWIATSLFGVKSNKELIGKFINEEEYKSYRQALEFIFQVRNALHNIAKKKQDIVSYDILPDLSSKLGFTNHQSYTKERKFMSKLFASLHIIHNFAQILLTKFTRYINVDISNIKNLKKYRYKKNIYIIEKRVYCSFYKKSVSLNQLIENLIDLPKDIEFFDTSYIYFASKSKMSLKQSNRLKHNIKILLQKENLYIFIKLLFDAKLLFDIFPLAKKMLNQAQFDGYHQHPVDLHSIQTLKFAQNIEDSYIKNIYDNLDKRGKTLSHLVALFHDIGKGRKEDHHIIGAKLFKQICKDLGFDEEFTKDGSLLVRYHNMMSYTATHEDIYSEKNILNFTAIVKSEKILQILYIVTYSDISAVGKNIFNSSTASLLKQLYLQSLLALENQELVKESARRVAKINAIKNLQKYKNLINSMKKKIQHISSNQIFLILKAEDILDIAIKANDVKEYIYKIRNEKQLIIRIIRKSPLNLGYLLGKLEFLNITSTNIYKLFDDKKAFEISFSQRVDDQDLPFIEQIIKDSFDMSKKVKSKIPIIKKENIKVDCNHTTYLASMHIRVKDQKGLFAYVAKIFDDFGIDIESAKLHTLKGYARDLILIEKNGNFCSNQEEIIELMCTEQSK